MSYNDNKIESEFINDHFDILTSAENVCFLLVDDKLIVQYKSDWCSINTFHLRN